MTLETSRPLTVDLFAGAEDISSGLDRVVLLSAAAESELLTSVGQDGPGLAALVKVGFDTLGLRTYLSAEPKESRAWTIRQGATAPQSAGVIHADFECGFIKAEIVGFADLDEYGSVAEARTHGKVRQEGKDYVMQDGDVVEFRFNTTSAGKK